MRPARCSRRRRRRGARSCCSAVRPRLPCCSAAPSTSDRRPAVLPAQGESALRAHARDPATRGRVLDRNGLILAATSRRRRCGRSRRTSTAAPEQRPLAAAAGMTRAELDAGSPTTRNFVWLRRQVDDATSRQHVRRCACRAFTSRASTSAITPRARPRRTSSASPTSKTAARKASSSPSRSGARRPRGTRRVIKDRLGRVVEDTATASRRSTAGTSRCRSTRRSSSSRTSSIRDAVAEHKAKAGSVVVLDAQTGEVLALANFPSYDPTNRAPPDAARSCAIACSPTPSSPARR